MKYHSLFKSTFEIEPYLKHIQNNSLRIDVSRFRLSSHNLVIEEGRLIKNERTNRICNQCYQNQVETEYHFNLLSKT